jgi:Cft2 family RNA processing exonuclease
LDHAASLPYFLEKVVLADSHQRLCRSNLICSTRPCDLICSDLQTTFKGRVFMTHATKAIYKLLLQDYVKVSKVSVDDMLYDEQDIIRSLDKIEVMTLASDQLINKL